MARREPSGLAVRHVTPKAEGKRNGSAELETEKNNSLSPSKGILDTRNKQIEDNKSSDVELNALFSHSITSLKRENIYHLISSHFESLKESTTMLLSLWL